MALQLHMTVRQLRATMSSMEWRDWHTYFRLRAQEEELATLQAKARAK